MFGGGLVGGTGGKGGSDGDTEMVVGKSKLATCTSNSADAASGLVNVLVMVCASVVASSCDPPDVTMVDSTSIEPALTRKLMRLREMPIAAPSLFLYAVRSNR